MKQYNNQEAMVLCELVLCINEFWVFKMFKSIWLLKEKEVEICEILSLKHE